MSFNHGDCRRCGGCNKFVHCDDFARCIYCYEMFDYRCVSCYEISDHRCLNYCKDCINDPKNLRLTVAHKINITPNVAEYCKYNNDQKYGFIHHACLVDLTTDNIENIRIMKDNGLREITIKDVLD